MLNCSLHADVLLKTLAMLKADDAWQTFAKHEQKSIVNVTAATVAIFRSLCAQHTIYGRVYLAMLDYHVSEPDTTGLLPIWHAEPVRWKCDWKPVAALCECTNATYVGFGCGNAAYWRVILPGRRAFLFEVSAEALLELAKIELPNTAHIVPVANTHFALAELEAKTIVLTRTTWSLSNTDGCVVHDLQPGKANSMFMQMYPNAKWKHTTCETADKSAAHALRMMLTQQ